MLIELLVATLMVLMTVSIHGFGLALLARALRGETQREHEQHIPPLSSRAMLFTLAIVVGLFALHGIEIWAYALLYLGLGATPDLETSVYFSTISYAAIGYGDSHIVPRWRILGAIEGINGVILLGWSTAFFVSMTSRLGRSR